MIPTMILFGLLAGLLPRPWYRVNLGIASVAWPLLLVQSGAIAISDQENMLGALAFGAANAALGVAVTRGLAAVVHRGGIVRWQERP